MRIIHLEAGFLFLWSLRMYFFCQGGNLLNNNSARRICKIRNKIWYFKIDSHHLRSSDIVLVREDAVHDNAKKIKTVNTECYHNSHPKSSIRVL